MKIVLFISSYWESLNANLQKLNNGHQKYEVSNIRNFQGFFQAIQKQFFIIIIKIKFIFNKQ